MAWQASLKRCEHVNLYCCQQVALSVSYARWSDHAVAQDYGVGLWLTQHGLASSCSCTGMAHCLA